MFRWLKSWLPLSFLWLVCAAGCDQQASRLAAEHGVRWGDSLRGIPYFDTAIELDPNNALAYAQRGYIRAKHGPYEMAAQDLQRAVDLDSEGVYFYEAYNGLAWLKATCNQAGIRDGEEAVRLATQACEFCNYEHEDVVDTLAAAYAETGDFESAVKWQEKAISLTDSERDPFHKLRGFYSRLQLYKDGVAYRE